jgi:dTDP-4-amino-4,6-dideoxygalactose transaminase
VTDWHVPLADVVVPEADIDAVADTYRSGWLSMGPRTEQLERAFEAYAGARHAIAVTNGTAALHLVCAGAGIGPGDEVVVPSLTFVATVNAIAYTGARPVFADIAGPTEPWLSPEAVEAAITPRTTAIMAMAYGGHPGELEQLHSLAERHGLLLLEDAAHATGSRIRGRHVGTFGAAAAFSFFSNKNLGIGEGGMVVTDDDEIAARIRLLRSHGMTTLSWDRHRGHATDYDVVALGFNYRIDEPRAALAERRLARLDAENRQRGELVERYRGALEGIDGIHSALPPVEGAELAHHLYAAVLEPEVDRREIRRELAERGVQTSVHYPPVHGFSIYSDRAADLPLTEAYGARTVTLPLFAHMSDSQQDLVIEALATAIAKTSPIRS